MGRKLRSALDLAKPDLKGTVVRQQERFCQNRKGQLRQFVEGEEVYVRNFGKGDEKWLSGKIVRVTGPLSYEIELLDKGVVKQHVDHMRRRYVTYHRLPNSLQPNK